MGGTRGGSAGGEGPLVLGPLLRHADATSATVWVETAGPAVVSVHALGRSWSARTFSAHGHHYALVGLDDLPPATDAPYTVEVDGEQAWPPAPAAAHPLLPAPRIRTLDPARPPSLAFGSCRTSVPHDAAGNRTHGIDALRAWGLALAEQGDRADWPDLVLFLGDQVYADETSEEMREFIAARRSLDEPPGEELKDYEEYAHLYRLAWGDDVVRWLLSTVPTAMVFDDHDVRDDWNTSAAWRADVAATSWWHERIVGGLGSYWVHQHLGNLPPHERVHDPLWSRVLAAPDEHVDLTDVLDAFAARADAEPASYRWSFERTLGRCRLVVVDSRAARFFEGGERRMLDPGEMAWLDERLTGDVDHLLVATSLPYLLPEGLHHVEAWSEAIAEGGWGGPGRRLGEKLRRAGDLEHWGAWQHDFQQVADAVQQVCRGERGQPPATVTFLSGDVHHSYLAEVEQPPGTAGTQVVQAVCSPIRNPLPRVVRFATAFAAYGVAGPLGTVLARSAKVPDAPFRWRLRGRPHYDNNLARLDVAADGDCYELSWWTGTRTDDPGRPGLRRLRAERVGRARSGGA